MSAAHRENSKSDEASLVGLDAYSKDNVFIGRVSGFLPVVPVSEQRVEEGHTDGADAEGRIIGERHVVINGAGTVVQSTIVVAVGTLDTDLRGRRVVVPMTVAEIEARPKHIPASDL